MEIPDFFERHQDKIVFRHTTYLDYFNLYPKLRFQPTFDHLQRLNEMSILNFARDSEGWQIAVKFHDSNFLLDTHFHGTSTLFCAEQGVSDTTVMLAFLGCFIPTIRDDWELDASSDVTTKNRLAFRRLLGWLGISG